MEAKDVSKIRNLINTLNEATKFYDEGHPKMSDRRWDDMYFELVKLEQETGDYYEDSPTQRVNYQVVNKLNKVIHDHPMLSLDKTKEVDEVESFIGNKEYIVMAKMDGLTCSLTYRDGRLIKAETRGNGLEGEDILHNALVIKNIPKKINFKEELVVDGEIICDYNSFKHFEEDYKNPRNFASGSIRLLDSKEFSIRRLSFVAWDCIRGLENEFYLSSKLSRLSDLGFTVVPFEIDFYNKDVLSNMEKVKAAAKKANYPIDGLVIKYNRCVEYDAAGRTDHHFKGGLAYKFYDEEYETTLLDIEWSMGRTGVLTPVAIVEPIEIDGTKVSRANLFNASVMYDTLHSCGWKGQKIWIYKANQIIPQVSEAEEDNELTKEYFIPPYHCPICGELTILETSNAGVENYICINPQCEGKLTNRIEHFFSKKGINAKGISKATIEKLINWNWVESITDIFELDIHREEWINKSGFGEKSVDNILNSIKEASHTTLESVIAAAGIPLIGRTVARDLVKRFNTYEDFKEAINSDFDFSTISGFGYEMNKSLKNFNYTELDLLVEHYLKIEEKEQVDYMQVIPGSTRFDGFTICITGKLNTWKNRNELKEYIENRGGKVTDTVSSKVNYLICNDLNSTSSKMKRAKELGIPVMTEDQFNVTVDF